MRVVAGEARGRPLVAPKGRDTRPTADRVREAVFNALHSLGGVEGATVLDLFAGSGALGIEALSRGAAHATFVDRDRQAVAAVRANLLATGLADRATVRQADALASLGDGRGPVDLALLDPPYAFGDGQWTDLLERLRAELVVVETDRELILPPRWRVLRSKGYGTTVVVIARQAGPRDDDGSQDGASQEGPHPP
ncbi:MAG: 16S rRNA (guanine(966)-N(2))-methyltransferase RsmD [Acidimicrobiia bacterium]